MTDIVEFPIPYEQLDPTAYPEFKGETGPATEWQASATHLQARPVGGDTWVDVVALEDIKGPKGDAGEGGGVSDDADNLLTEGTDGLAYLDSGSIPASGAGERRHAYASPYIYCGTAPAGTLDDATIWLLTRITLDAEGAVVSTETATDAWDDRVTATYS